MEIVINIPKEWYESIMNGNSDALNAEFVKKGIVLPKGHGRLIDADLFVQKHPLAFVRDVINDAPTIIEADKEG